MKKLLLIISILFISNIAFADNTSFNPNSVALAPRTTDTTPIGTVVIWSNNQAFPNINGNTVWLPCNGQEIPVGVEYDELRTALASNNLPNYNNEQFLQGATSNIGQEVAEQSKILNVDIPAHKHDLSGGVAGGQTIVSGGASGQGFTYNSSSSGDTYIHYGFIAGSSSYPYQSKSIVVGINEYPYAIWKITGSARLDYSATFLNFALEPEPLRLYRSMLGTKQEDSSSSTSPVYSITDGGSIYGTTSASGLSGTTGAAGATTMTIKDTTAPAHTKVMYYIKARD